MKKNIKKSITLIFATLIAVLFTSCFDPIYNVVLHDVQPEKATVSGHQINSIARFHTEGKEYLVLAANGGLRYKEADAEGHGKWNVYNNLPFALSFNNFDTGKPEGEFILKVVANSNTLYLATANFTTTIPTGNVYACSMTDGWNTAKTEWKNITNISKVNIGYNHYTVFSTNDPNPLNRKAYLRVDETKKEDDKEITTYKYYILSDATCTEIEAPIAIDDSKLPVYNVVSVGSDVKFFNSPAVVTNATVSTDATMIYFGKGEDLYYGPVAGPFDKKVSAGSPIAALAICSDSILIGCGIGNFAGGIRHAYLDKSTKAPGAINTKFNTNAAAQIPTSYQVPCLLNATPDKSELDSHLYATVTFTGVPAGTNHEKDKGLWSYYPTRKNWNRE